MNSSEMKSKIEQTKQEMIDQNDQKQMHEQLRDDFSQSPMRARPEADQEKINAASDRLADLRAEYSQMQGEGEIVPDMDKNPASYSETIFYENDAAAVCPNAREAGGWNGQLKAAKERYDEAMVENLEGTDSSARTNESIERDKQIIHEARANMDPIDSSWNDHDTIRSAQNEHERNVIDTAAAHLAKERAHLSSQEGSGQIVPDIEGNDTQFEETLFAISSDETTPEVRAVVMEDDPAADFNEKYETAQDRFQTGTDGIAVEEADVEINLQEDEPSSPVDFVKGLFASSDGQNTSAVTLSDFNDHPQDKADAIRDRSAAEHALRHAADELNDAADENPRIR